MSNFEQLHPDVIEVLPSCKRYVQYSISGAVIEAWEKDDNGMWHDVTLREQEIERAKRELKAAMRELNRVEEQDA